MPRLEAVPWLIREKGEGETKSRSAMIICYVTYALFCSPQNLFSIFPNYVNNFNIPDMTLDVHFERLFCTFILVYPV